MKSSFAVFVGILPNILPNTVCPYKPRIRLNFGARLRVSSQFFSHFFHTVVCGKPSLPPLEFSAVK